MMHRSAAVLLLTLICGRPLLAGDLQPNSSRPLKIHLIARNVYMLESEPQKPSYGSNIAVLVGPDGLLLVDAQGSPDVQPAIAALRTISDKPIRYVINTHCHGDHTGGNTGFQRAGATIIAHDNVRKRLQQGTSCGPQTGLPTLTFGSELTLYFDDELVRIIKLPTGHTDGDVMVYFERARVVATGDAFTSNGLPEYSRAAGGNMLGSNDELHQIVALLPDNAQVIPGHGPVASMIDVRVASKALDGIRDAIAAQVAQGKTLEQIQAMKLLEPWKDLVEDSDRPMYTRFYYECLKAPATPTST
jgi:cyclase